MLFTVIDKARWKDHNWDKFFNLVNDFKSEFKFELRSIDHMARDRYSFSLSGFIISCEPNSQGFWVTLQADTSKTDFDEKYEFIFNRLKEEDL